MPFFKSRMSADGNNDREQEIDRPKVGKSRASTDFTNLTKRQKLLNTVLLADISSGDSLSDDTSRDVPREETVGTSDSFLEFLRNVDNLNFQIGDIINTKKRRKGMLEENKNTLVNISKELKYTAFKLYNCYSNAKKEQSYLEGKLEQSKILFNFMADKLKDKKIDHVEPTAVRFEEPMSDNEYGNSDRKLLV